MNEPVTLLRPDSPSTDARRDSTGLPPDLLVSAGLDRLVLSCLEKQPADRPPDAANLSRSLAAIAAEPWGEEQALQWWQANRTA